MRNTILGLLAVCFVGCVSGGKDVADTDGADTDVVDTDIGDTDAIDTDNTDSADTGTPDTDPDTDPPPESCKDANGICTSTDACGRGRALPAFAGDCVFDDGPGVCCKAPAEQPTGDTCRELGGVCAPVGGCYMVDGFLAATPGCTAVGGPSYVCCVPEAQCGPAEYECCTDSTVFVSTCTHGVENCDNLAGTVLSPIGTCLVP